MSNIPNNSMANIPFTFLQSSCFNLHYSRKFCRTISTETPSLDRKEESTCEDCGSQTTTLNLAPHKKRCSTGNYCARCPKFSTRSHADLNFHVAKNIAYHNHRKLTSVRLCHYIFVGFHSPR